MKNILFLLFLFSFSSFAQIDFTEIDDLIAAGHLQKAKEKLLKSSSKDMRILEYLGDISSYQKDWDAASSYYKKLVEKEPSNAEYNFKYGGALGLKALEVSKFQALVYISDIKEYLEKAANLDAQHEDSRAALAELYMKLPGIIGGSEQKSKKYANELEKINPVKGAIAQAFIHKEKGEERKARDKYREAISILENSEEKKISNPVNYKLGKASADYQIFPAVGLKLLDNFIRNYSFKDSNSLEDAFYHKARLHALLNDKSEAIKSIEKSLALKPDFQDAQVEKQRILKMK